MVFSCNIVFSTLEFDLVLLFFWFLFVQRAPVCWLIVTVFFFDSLNMVSLNSLNIFIMLLLKSFWIQQLGPLRINFCWLLLFPLSMDHIFPFLYMSSNCFVKDWTYLIIYYNNSGSDSSPNPSTSDGCHCCYYVRLIVFKLTWLDFICKFFLSCGVQPLKFLLSCFVFQLLFFNF